MKWSKVETKFDNFSSIKDFLLPPKHLIYQLSYIKIMQKNHVPFCTTVWNTCTFKKFLQLHLYRTDLFMKLVHHRWVNSCAPVTKTLRTPANWMLSNNQNCDFRRSLGLDVVLLHGNNADCLQVVWGLRLGDLWLTTHVPRLYCFTHLPQIGPLINFQRTCRIPESTGVNVSSTRPL